MNNTINEKKGSKKRFIELMSKVNKVSINENFDQIRKKPEEFLEKGISVLKNGDLFQERRGSNQTKTQISGNEMIINIKGEDVDGNSYEYVFTIVGENNFDDDIFVVDDIVLDKYVYESYNKKESIEIDGDDLDFANKGDNSNFFDVLEKYVGSELIDGEGEDSTDGEVEINENAITHDQILGVGVDKRSEFELDYEDPAQDTLNMEPEEGETFEGGGFDPTSAWDNIKEMYYDLIRLEEALSGDEDYVALRKFMTKMLSKKFDFINSFDNEDKDLEDVLLGYRPKNVGDV